MNDKYYTPIIEEFHIGFEYDLIYDDEIKSLIFNENDMEHVFDFETEDLLGGLIWKLIHNRIRVKYLDSDDIENLGFDLLATKCGKSVFDLNNIWITLNENNFIEILNTNLGERDLNIKGMIKNKSELRKLLKQLNIL